MSILGINAYHRDVAAVLLSACAVHADRRDGKPLAAVEEA